MAMKGSTTTPPREDPILNKPFRVLGTTDDRYSTLAEAIKAAEYHARLNNSRIYIVKVIGHCQVSSPPVDYLENTFYYNP